MLARDVSNYTVPLTAALLAQWKAEGVGLVLIQAFPPSYGQYAEQRDQMAMCAQEGMPFDGYIYDYLGDPTWLRGALDGLDQALLPSLKPRQLWLDEEDTETEAGWSQQQRVAAIKESEVAAVLRGYSTGIYTSPWWWVPRTGNSTSLRTLNLWAAQYDGIADASVFTPFGGWASCSIKQYAGSQPGGTDLNVLSTDEEAELTKPEEPLPDPSCDQYKAALERAVNRVQIELDRKTTAGKSATLRRKVFKEIGSELFQALQT